METKNFLRTVALCLWIANAILILPSCSNKAGESKAEDPKADKAAAAMPAGAMPLSAVLRTVENNGYTPIVEVEFEKNHWEIKAYKGNQLVQLNVNLINGEVVPNPAPQLDKPLSTVIKNLEDQGYGPIVDVERAEDRPGGWDVEAYKGQSEVKIGVEAGSGKVTAK